MTVEVPGVGEGRPQVQAGDTVHLIPKQELEEPFEGRIYDIEDNHIVIEVGDSFPFGPEALFDVNFIIDRQMIKRMHLAVRKKLPSDALLFPGGSGAVANVPSKKQQNRIREILFDSRIASNGPQLQAITAITSRAWGSAPYIIFGPYVVSYSYRLCPHTPTQARDGKDGDRC